MNKITRIEFSTCKILRDKLNERLAEIGEELGLSINAGNARYDDTSITFKVQCVITGVDKAKEDFERHAFKFNLPDDAYGKTFNNRGVDYTLCGLKPNSPKYPILGKRADGEQYKFQESAVKSLQIKVEVTKFDPNTTKNLRGNGEIAR